MKKLIGLLLLGSGSILAAPRLVPSIDQIGPATSTASTITISSSTNNGSRTCLTELRASVATTSPQSNIKIDILNGGTTIYNLDASTGNPVQMFWNESDPFCITPNNALVITSTATLTPTPVINVNYKGYSY